MNKPTPKIPKTITKPTVIYDLPDADYHAHKGSLSASGAKWLAPPDACPAKHRWHADNQTHKATFDFGHAAHRIVLDKGADIEVLINEDGDPFDSFRTKASQQASDAAREAGRVPMLEAEHARAKKVAAAVMLDPLIGHVFTPGTGDAEVSLFWPDPETGVIRRARLDWLTKPVDGRRRLIVDLKTAKSAEPNAFSKSAADYGYAISAANYVDGVIACGLADDPAYLLAVVEKDPPYVVSPFQIGDDLLQLGRALMRKAIRLYADCTEAGHWPGYLTDIEPLALPGYYLHRIEETA